jgi:Domain of unknown function (DUF1918)
MFARVGDWLVVESRNEGRAARRGEIVEVARADGAPPYRVRWDADHQALVFPGPDARVFSTDRLASLDEAHAG